MRGIVSILFILVLQGYGLKAQESLMDDQTRNLLDSLNNRIKILEQQMPRISQNRDANYYARTRDLDMTIFLSNFYLYLFNEELDEAKQLVDSRLKASTKRKDNFAIDFYNHYQDILTKELGKQRTRYENLFAKEKNFKKEFYRFVNEGNEYSLNRARRMTTLAQKYAVEKNLNDVSVYLENYSRLIDSYLYDFHSEFELDKLTRSEAAFQKVYTPLVESDSLEIIEKAGELVDHCYTYSANSLSILDTSYFAIQKNAYLSAISDYYERKGNKESLSGIGNESQIARLDTLNNEGIYKWHDKILVVGHIDLTAKFDNVRRGEAIIDADRKLIEYIKVNRIAKIDKVVSMGNTFLIPYTEHEQKEDFRFNPQMRKYQYMVCYSVVETKYFTKGISKFLPPIEFSEESSVK